MFAQLIFFLLAKTHPEICIMTCSDVIRVKIPYAKTKKKEHHMTKTEYVEMISIFTENTLEPYSIEVPIITFILSL